MQTSSITRWKFACWNETLGKTEIKIANIFTCFWPALQTLPISSPFLLPMYEYNRSFFEFCNNQCIEKIWPILPELFPKNPTYRRHLEEVISHRKLLGLNTASFPLYIYSSIMMMILESFSQWLYDTQKWI